jgi:hypothetical protein
MIERVLFSRTKGTGDRRLTSPPSEFCSGCLLPFVVPQRGAAASVPSGNLVNGLKTKQAFRQILTRLKASDD